LLRRLKKHEQIAAVPIYQPPPVLASGDSQSLTREVSVNVKVYVSETGLVKKAEITDLGDEPNWKVARAAEAAAGAWRFQPARMEDMAVSSELILHFRFMP
jgi:hypothetical protein